MDPIERVCCGGTPSWLAFGALVIRCVHGLDDLVPGPEYT
jgi:hypothetical protein